MVAPWNPTSAHYTTINQPTNETIVMEARGVQSYSRKIQHNNQIEIDYRSFDEKERLLLIEWEVFEKKNIR
jgi:hypothetical protein